MYINYKPLIKYLRSSSTETFPEDNSLPTDSTEIRDPLLPDTDEMLESSDANRTGPIVPDRTFADDYDSPGDYFRGSLSDDQDSGETVTVLTEQMPQSRSKTSDSTVGQADIHGSDTTVIIPRLVNITYTIKHKCINKPIQQLNNSIKSFPLIYIDEAMRTVQKKNQPNH